VLKIKIRRLYY